MLRSLCLLGLLITLSQSINAARRVDPIGDGTITPAADDIPTKKIRISVTNKTFLRRDILLAHLADSELDEVGRSPWLKVLQTRFASRITQLRLAPGETRETDLTTFSSKKGMLMIRIAPNLDTKFGVYLELEQGMRTLPGSPFPNIMRFGGITPSEAADEYNQTFNGPIIYFECEAIALPPAPDWAAARRA